MLDNEKRSFTILKSTIHSVSGGRFISKSAYSAAKKAARKIFRDDHTKTSMKFLIREVTAGSQKKRYCFVAHKKVLSAPTVVTLKNGKSITYHHNITVHSCKDVQLAKKYVGGEEVWDIVSSS